MGNENNNIENDQNSDLTSQIKQEKQLSNLGVGRASPRKIYMPREKSAAVIAKERAATDENYDAAAEYQKWKNTHIRLNFTLYSAKSRNSQVWDICEDKDRTFTEKDLETMANFILYGKDEDGTSIVDRKEVEIGTRYSSFKKKGILSLEMLQEDVTFDESSISTSLSNKFNRSVKKAPSFSREENSFIEPLKPLWNEIDKKVAFYEYYKDNKPLSSFSPELQEYLLSTKAPSSLALYKLRHTIIEMRTEQYSIRDQFVHQIQPSVLARHYYGDESRNEIPWQTEGYPVYPLGFYTSKNPNFDLFTDKESFIGGDRKDFKGEAFVPKEKKEDAIVYLDFTDPSHIYMLIRYYMELVEAADKAVDSTAKMMLDTLEFYIAAAHLKEECLDVLECKKYKMSNVYTTELVNKKYGKRHANSYVSTMFKGQICKEIAEAAQLHYDTYMARKDESKFKRCNKCGHVKLRDIRNFARKRRASDGLSGRCKECDRIERMKRKEKENQKKNETGNE